MEKQPKNTLMNFTDTSNTLGATHYAQLLAALFRSAGEKPHSERMQMLQGVVWSISQNPEPERSAIKNFVMLELSMAQGRELVSMMGGVRRERRAPPSTCI